MARKTMKLTEEKIQALLRSGRGRGEGADYLPWLQVGNFSSQGRSHRIRDHQNGRIHHLFSDLEADYYYILAWADAVVDIREQFPLLPAPETERIAVTLGYRHPRNPGGSCPEVMTTDFLITVRDAEKTHLEARYVKFEKDLRDERVCEKLEIEKTYWMQKGVPFKVVTEHSFNRTKAKSICMLLGHYDPATVGDLGEWTKEAADNLLESLIDKRYLQLRECTTRMDIQYGFSDGTALALFYHLAAHKVIPLRIEEKPLPTQPVNCLVDIEQLRLLGMKMKGGEDDAGIAE